MSATIFPHLLAALEQTRDLLCAFHRDQPEKYQPMVSDALRAGLAQIEYAKGAPVEPDSKDDPDYRQQAQYWKRTHGDELAKRGALQARFEQFASLVSKEVECYCTSEGVAAKGGFPCAKCMADAALKSLEGAQS